MDIEGLWRVATPKASVASGRVLQSHVSYRSTIGVIKGNTRSLENSSCAAAHEARQVSLPRKEASKSEIYKLLQVQPYANWQGHPRH